MNLGVFIPLITFLILFIIAKKRKNKISMTIIGLFLLSSICSLFMNSEVLPFHDFGNDSFFNFILYTFLLVPFLLLTYKIKPIKDLSKLPSGLFLNIFVVVFSIGGLYSFFYLLPYAVTALQSSAHEVRVNIQNESVLPKSIFTTIAVGFSTFYYIYTFLFYVYMVKQESKIVRFFMLLGLLSFIVNVFTVSGRDGVYLAFMSLIIGYFLFENLINDKIKIKLKKALLYTFSFFLFFITVITIDRFQTSQDTSTLLAFKQGIVAYFGMQPFIFNDYIIYFTHFNYGSSSFPIIIDFFDNTKVVYIAERSPYMWNFGTFLTSFYSVNGIFSLFAITFIFIFYFKLNIYLINKNALSPLALLFFYSLFFHFIVSGLFYFRLGNNNGNLFLIISVLAVFFFKKKIKSS